MEIASSLHDHGHGTTVVFLTHLTDGQVVDSYLEDEDGHWVAVAHSLEDERITQYDSLGGTNEWRSFSEASEDVRLQWMVVNFLGKNRSNVSLIKMTHDIVLTAADREWEHRS